MALGSHVLGQAADRVAHPLKLYVYLELAIGAYGLLFEPSSCGRRGVFIALATASGLSAGGLAGGRSRPVCSRFCCPRFSWGARSRPWGAHRAAHGRRGPHIARLYFINSLGAVAGLLLAGSS